MQELSFLFCTISDPYSFRSLLMFTLGALDDESVIRHYILGPQRAVLILQVTTTDFAN